MKKHGNRYCTCGTKLQKGGKNKLGKQRWRCKVCNKIYLINRDDVSLRNTQKTFINGLTNSASKRQLSIRNTMDSKRFKPCGSKVPTIETYPGHTYGVVVIDAINLKTGTKLDERTCLIACANGEVIAYIWAKYESSGNGMKLFKLINISYAIVCDGQKGMLASIRARGPHVGVQRCLVHIHRNIISKITRNPELEPGQYLLGLVNDLMDLRTEIEMHRGINAFYVIYDKYRDFLNEGSYEQNVLGKRVKRGRTHRRLRSAFKEIDNELNKQTLFVYLINPAVPKTTNDVEGGINKQLRKLLGDHCGLTFEKQKSLVETYLYKRRKKDC